MSPDTKTPDAPAREWKFPDIPPPKNHRQPGSPATTVNRHLPRLIPHPAPQGLPEQIGPTAIGSVQFKNLVTKPHPSGFIGEYDHVINPYVGCSFGCQYCYASNFMTNAQQKKDWGLWTLVKTNAIEQIQNLPPGILDRQTVYMATVTDPYQPVERTARITRAILEAMAQRQPRVKLVIQTRSTLAARDTDLFQAIAQAGGKVQVNMTVTTDSEAVRKIYEPGCSSINARLKAITSIHQAGVQACVTMTPLLPVEEPTGFAHRLLNTGIRRFIIQPFRHPSQTKGNNVALTDQRAIECAVRHFQADTPAEAIRRYDAGYQRDFKAIQSAFREHPGVTLGQDRHGFRPPF